MLLHRFHPKSPFSPRKPPSIQRQSQLHTDNNTHNMSVVVPPSFQIGTDAKPALTTPTSPSSDGVANGHKKVDHGNGVDKLAYTDDDAGVKLKSTDGRVFKVHSYLLKAHR